MRSLVTADAVLLPLSAAAAPAAAITITGDAICRATNVDCRLDTESARAFLADYVALP